MDLPLPPTTAPTPAPSVSIGRHPTDRSGHGTETSQQPARALLASDSAPSEHVRFCHLPLACRDVPLSEQLDYYKEQLRTLRFPVDTVNSIRRHYTLPSGDVIFTFPTLADSALLMRKKAQLLKSLPSPTRIIAKYHHFGRARNSQATLEAQRVVQALARNYEAQQARLRPTQPSPPLPNPPQSSATQATHGVPPVLSPTHPRPRTTRWDMPARSQPAPDPVIRQAAAPAAPMPHPLGQGGQAAAPPQGQVAASATARALVIMPRQRWTPPRQQNSSHRRAPLAGEAEDEDEEKEESVLREEKEDWDQQRQQQQPQQPQHLHLQQQQQQQQQQHSADGTDWGSGPPRRSNRSQHDLLYPSSDEDDLPRRPRRVGPLVPYHDSRNSPSSDRGDIALPRSPLATPMDMDDDPTFFGGQDGSTDKLRRHDQNLLQPITGEEDGQARTRDLEVAPMDLDNPNKRKHRALSRATAAPSTTRVADDEQQLRLVAGEHQQVMEDERLGRGPGRGAGGGPWLRACGGWG